MKSDNSMLAHLCDQWGLQNGVFKVGKWGADDFGADGEGRFYNHAAFVTEKHHWQFALYGRWECDDINLRGLSTVSGDFWKIFVR